MDDLRQSTVLTDHVGRIVWAVSFQLDAINGSQLLMAVRGQPVGPGTPAIGPRVLSGSVEYDDGLRGTDGHFGNVVLGIALASSAGTQYAWVMSGPFGAPETLEEGAFNSNADVPIIAGAVPAPGSLAAALVGAGVFAARRRR